MVSTKSMTTAENAAKATQEQAVTAATTGLQSSVDGAHGVPSPRNGELEDEMEKEAIRVSLDRLVAAFETEPVERLAERREREEESRRVWRRFDEVQAALEALRGAQPPPQKSNGDGTGGSGLSAAGESPAGGGAEGSDPVAPGGSPTGGTTTEDLPPAADVMEAAAVAASEGDQAGASERVGHGQLGCGGGPGLLPTPTA
ncbi:unnamed protein product [Linum trigynum]|uniref:Uncharacterized protein n=1 Tax=Linum trigynum TaxID=586398 RepID=A0AAV2G4L1_9ROSI